MEQWRKDLYSSELYHHGILGMKWGVRRYQNKDGTLTEAGKRRARNGVNPSDLRNAQGGLQSAQNAADNASRATARVGGMKQKQAADKVDVSSMSDAELQRAVNRLNMERQYKSLSTEDSARGYEYASNVLATVGSVVGIASGVVGIAVAISSMQKKG